MKDVNHKSTDNPILDQKTRKEHLKLPDLTVPKTSRKIIIGIIAMLVFTAITLWLLYRKTDKDKDEDSDVDKNDVKKKIRPVAGCPPVTV